MLSAALVLEHSISSWGEEGEQDCFCLGRRGNLSYRGFSGMHGGAGCLRNLE